MARTTKKEAIKFDSATILESIKDQSFKEGYMKACNDLLSCIVNLMNVGCLSKEEQLKKIQDQLKVAEELTKTELNIKN